MVESVTKRDAAPADSSTRGNASTASSPSTSPASSPRSPDDMVKQLEQRKKNASQLAGGYTKSKQMMETISIFTFAGIFVYCLWKLQYIEGKQAAGGLGFGIIAWCAVSALVALLAADFVGGFAHWLFDTWGTVEFPVVGPTFVRSFREHHVNPNALAHHDWREANGDNCLAVLLILIPTSLCSISLGPTQLGSGVMSLPLYIGMLLFLFFVMYTNQIHKYAHMRPKDVPAWARAMQDRGLFMSKKHHNVHHSTFDAYYCITTGWMNYPLELIGFWRNLENLITRVTGVEPRTDDMKWTAGFGTTDGIVKDK